jgi:hypothetical protein
MEYDNEALEAKKSEIQALPVEAIRRVNRASEEAVESAVEAFTRLTPPTDPEPVIEMITVGSFGRGGGKSRKPGNIYLNWQKLMDIVPDATIATAGALTSPAWLLPLIGLYVWNKLWRGAEEDLTEVEACTIFALWKNRNGQSKISEDEGFVRNNALREQQDMPALLRSEYDVAINRLLRMECIEIENGIVWLREWVRIQY